jgi:hypothetical protein
LERAFFALLFFATFAACSHVARAQQAAAEICEIVNESKSGVRFVVLRDGVAPREYLLNPKAQTQVATSGAALLELAGGRVRLAAGTRYAVRENAKGEIVLAAVGRRATPARPNVRPAPDRPDAAPPTIKPALPAPNVPGLPITPATGDAIVPIVPRDAKEAAPRQAARVATVTVKICVDDEEAARDEIWKKRLADRLAAASAIVEKSSGVRFAAVEFARWDSNDDVRDFVRSLGEFEHEVDPGRARLAIGFCSQYEITRREVHLGGTRGPLHPYILVREWSRHIAEPERLEVLVHELGHFLGAVHSGDSASVMRPKLGDRRSRAVDFEIRFDDPNAQIMRLFGDEMRLRPVRRLAELSDRAKADLLARYDALAKANPKDPAVKRHIELVEQSGGERNAETQQAR